MGRGQIGLGAVVVVQRGVCTFLDKARRVQEAGGVGVLFVNSAETLFVPHGTDDDPGGSVPRHRRAVIRNPFTQTVVPGGSAFARITGSMVD